MPADPSPTVGDQEPGPVGLLARLFLTQLLAVLAIATVIAVAFSLLGLDDRSSVETTTRQADGSSTTDGATAESTPPAEGSSPPSEPPPDPTSQSPSTGAAAAPRVDVLNQSAGSGIAESTAEGLRDRGWRIGRVDNFTGNVRRTTVYFPSGLRSEARDLAAEFDSEPRVLPAFSTLAPGRLTVVLVG